MKMQGFVFQEVSKARAFVNGLKIKNHSVIAMHIYIFRQGHKGCSSMAIKISWQSQTNSSIRKNAWLAWRFFVSRFQGLSYCGSIKLDK